MKLPRQNRKGQQREQNQRDRYSHMLSPKNAQPELRDLFQGLRG
jgi:hypothetical protein